MKLVIDVQRLAEKFLAGSSFKTSSKMQIETIQFASSYVKFFAKWLDNLDIEKVIDNKKQI